MIKCTLKDKVDVTLILKIAKNSKMPYKGHSNNPKGKPPGTLNVKTKQWAELGEAIITTHAERFNNILNNCDEEEFANKFLQVLEYFKPKLQRVDMNAELDVKSSIIINMDDSAE